ncbi:MAG: hypothetical protein E6G31_05505 [Actinobacteria bacterium]|nr:MAG: hypothetical protein E6G31_05505 [Actinomycetota bacterium]
MGGRALLVALALVVAGCGGGAGEGASPEPTQSQASTQTTSPPAPTPVEHFGYIRSVSTAGPVATLAFDEAQFLTGQQAQKAAEEDGVVPPGEPVPNDYYIRNPDKTTRTLRIANDAKITAKRCQPCRNGQPGQLGPFLASFMKGRQTYADPYRGKYSLYWLTIENGEVVAVDEQYVP